MMIGALNCYPARPRRRPVAVTAVSVAALALLAPAAAPAKPPPRESATPQQLRDYYSSGAYLADVGTAVAPAKTFLAQRMDQIDRERSACAAADLATGAAPAARSAPRAGVRATSATGRVTLTLRRFSLRRARARLTGTGVTVSRAGSQAVLTVGSASVTPTVARVALDGTLVLRRGSRRVTLREVALRLTPRATTVSAVVGARRVVVLTSTAGARRPTLSAAGAGAAVKAASLRLTAAGARALRVVRLHRGLIGRVTARASADGSAPAAPPAFVPSASACSAVPTKPAMVLDIDETALSAYLAGGDPGGGAAGQEPELVGTAVALPPVLDLFRYARSRGVAVDFITARIQPQVLNTGANLDREGYGDRIGITFRTTTSEDPGQYKRDARQALQQQQGYTILANVGDQCSDLYDGQAERSFKLPNTFYYTDGKKDPSCDPDG